jgi:hypothetical protein
MAAEGVAPREPFPTLEDLAFRFADMEARWHDGVSRDDVESVFALFVAYPATRLWFLKKENWSDNENAEYACDNLDLAHRAACRTLAKWACRLGLNGGLLEVSGEHCRKIASADRSEWLVDDKDGRWPYCLGAKLYSLPQGVSHTINDAEVVFKQLQHALKIRLEDEDTIIAKLFRGERNVRAVERGEGNGGTDKRFRVALSFPGEHREFLAEVANGLARDLGQERVFYDKYYEAELARPDLDTYLQKIYHDDSDLIAVFLCAEYEKKDWCGLEWRAIRDLIKKRNSSAIMPFRFDNTSIPGLFSIDGYVEIGQRLRDDVASLILQRLEHNEQQLA